MYKIVRFFQDKRFHSRVLRKGLTLEDVKRYTKNPETSSRTCTSSYKKAYTKRYGPWFDGYTVE